MKLTTLKFSKYVIYYYNMEVTEKQYYSWFKTRFAHTSSFLNGIIFMAFDSIGVIISIGIGFFIVNAIDKELIVLRDFVNYSIYLPAFIIVFFVARLYPGIMLQPAEEVRRFALSSLFCFAGIALSIAVETDDRTALSFALLIAAPVAGVVIPLIRELLRSFFSPFPWWSIPVVIYTSEKNKNLIVEKLLKNTSLGYAPALLIIPNHDSLSPSSYKNIPVLRPSPEIHAEILKAKITTAIIIEDPITALVEDVFLTKYRYLITVPHNNTLSSVSLSVRDFGGLLGFSNSNRLTRNINLFLKRFIDLFLILLFLPILIPLIILLSILVKFSSPGPVFFGHKRIGKNGKTITTWKFRSMVNNADEVLQEILQKNPDMQKQWEEQQKIDNDPRVTAIGKFLRKTSLDELPQLLNILLGQMSFVGPRPIVEAEKIKYGKKFNYIFSVTPGLSGMWQISGRSDVTYNERIILDQFYIQNWSIWLDIWIILQTAVVVLRGKGAY